MDLAAIGSAFSSLGGLGNQVGSGGGSLADAIAAANLAKGSGSTGTQQFNGEDIGKSIKKLMEMFKSSSSGGTLGGTTVDNSGI